ncbi:MAG: peptide chain release factor N(5)-glutamine methyltransferase [Ruminococcaceae bacterium]|nr:peptide chain release factor N(5)-glutamine methyltransferase [Oscillospiraceae bacterium]
MSGMNIGELLRECTQSLSEGGNDNARFEAEQLIMRFCGVTRNDMLIFPARPVTEEQEESVRQGTARRNSGEPLQYILGEWEFYGLPFEVGPGVLIPRQDTETLAELALGFVKSHPGDGFQAADLCAGSGCIGITLAALGKVPVRLVELSDRALEYLRRNIALNGVSDLCEAVQGDVLSDRTAEQMPLCDLIVTNPPYLTEKDMRELQTEVKFEPETALAGGVDGLDYYRRMIPLWSERLKPGGMLAAEIGMGQESDVMQMFEECGMRAQYKNDLCGVIRVIYGIKDGGNHNG